MIVSIWGGTTGELDEIPVGDVRRFEQEFLSHLRHSHKGILDAISQNNDLSDDTVEALKDAIRQFRQSFLAGETKPVPDAPAKPSDASGDKREKVTREVRPTEGG
jgi:F-type H+-transporting ATPase subunit alpha